MHQAFFQLSSLSKAVSDLADNQKALSQSILRLEANLADQRQADLNQFYSQLSTLSIKQQEMAAQLPQAHLSFTLLDCQRLLISLIPMSKNWLPLFQKLNQHP